MEKPSQMECIRCDKTIKVYCWDGMPNNPDNAVLCETDGNYGSRVLDCNGFSIVFILCDDCIVSNKHNERKMIGLRRETQRINKYTTFNLSSSIPHPDGLEP